MVKKTNASSERREQLRKEYWKEEEPWTGENEKGWFRALRTLPFVLGLLSSKSLSGNSDPTKVYLEILARHIDGGVVEMTNEADHAYAAGYIGTRGVRSWQERMQILEKLGFIKTKHIGNQRYRYVLLVHPTVAVQLLRDAGKVDQLWWDTYRARQIEVKEESYEDRRRKKNSNVISIEQSKSTVAK
jgi:hypothetical protein